MCLRCLGLDMAVYPLGCLAVNSVVGHPGVDEGWLVIWADYMCNNSIHINVRTQKWHSTVRIWSVLFTWHGWLIYFVCPKLHNNPLNICCLKTKTLKPHGGSSAGQITPLRMDVSHFECLYNSILKELCLALSCNNLTILVDSLHSDDMFCAGPMYL